MELEDFHGNHLRKLYSKLIFNELLQNLNSENLIYLSVIYMYVRIQINSSNSLIEMKEECRSALEILRVLISYHSVNPLHLIRMKLYQFHYSMAHWVSLE